MRLASLLLLLAYAAVAQPISTGNDKMNKPFQSDKWIDKSEAAWVWPKAIGDAPNQYVQMVHEFTISAETTGPAELVLSADTDYAVWLNGQWIDFGQWSNYPNDKTYDLLSLVNIRADQPNRLCVLVYYQGQSSSEYRKGPAGLLYALRVGEKVVAASGADTRMRRAPDYVSGPVPLVTGQLGFTFDHHGDKSDDWLNPDYTLDQTWQIAAAADMQPLASRPVRPRPISKLTLEKRLPMRIVAQGVFERNGSTDTIALAMQTDSLGWRNPSAIFTEPKGVLEPSGKSALTIKSDALRSATGSFVVLDTGREEAGLLDLEIDAPKGTIVDVAYGEHLEDLRVRAHVGGRNFAVRHTCVGGKHEFLHPFLRLAGRYIELHITPATSETGPITIYYAGMRPTPYPVPMVGRFLSSNTLNNQINEVSKDTLHLCMHEHFEDCPWREQSLYGMDSRNQALAGYYCFGNYDFVAASIDLLGKGMAPDGFLELCAPAEVSITIPSFSLAWILMLDDYLLFSGDRTFVKERLPIARQILATCERDSTGALVKTPKGRRMWNFYEWAPGLDGAGPRGFEDVQEERYEAPLNLFYLLALDATARMSHECGENDTTYTARAQAVRKEFPGMFLDQRERAVLTRVGGAQPRHFAELTQALAILAKAIPVPEMDQLRQRLAADKNGFVPCTISHTLYKFEALLTDKERYGTRVFELIQRDWSYMLKHGATSFWETIDGASAFGDAGSLCHGWSGIPAWFYGAHMLGVRPTSPGFAEYTFDPLPAGETSAEGIVPTPGGVIHARWNIEQGQLKKQVVRQE